MISIITPSYNSKKFIAQTIESVLKQTYKDWEMLIVDDCSTDNSIEIIRNYTEKDNRIKVESLQNNMGAGEARNVALRKAKGRFIAFLDSDDIWEPTKLDKQLSFMQKENIAFCFTTYDRITEENKYINTYNTPKSITYHQFLKNTIIGTSTVMIDREQTGNFEMPSFKTSQDTALWCTILKRVDKAYSIQEVLTHYREVTSSNSSKKLKAARDLWKVYTVHENLNKVKAFYYFCFYAYNAVKKRLIKN